MEDKIYYGTDTSEEGDPKKKEHFLKIIAESMQGDIISFHDIIEIN